MYIVCVGYLEQQLISSLQRRVGFVIHRDRGRRGRSTLRWGGGLEGWWSDGIFRFVEFGSVEHVSSFCEGFWREERVRREDRSS